jgi:CRP/FNR family transcriptional regulator, cyclic AMP receptor protein
MTALNRYVSGRCHLLREDSELAEAIAPAKRQRVTDELVARTICLPPGHWSGERSESTRGIGLLVTQGLLVRSVGIGEVCGAELLGAGDLLRPWQGEDAMATLFQRTGWRVLEPTVMAVLDRHLTTRLVGYPELMEQLVGRALARSRNLAANMAIVHQARVDVRLHMLLWHLADRWGYVRPDGVALPVHLTHAVLADLVAARRPTVTRALSELTARGLVAPMAKGWLLLGQPPGDLAEVRLPDPLETRSGACPDDTPAMNGGALAAEPDLSAR